jgi:hypothetical protein
MVRVRSFMKLSLLILLSFPGANWPPWKCKRAIARSTMKNVHNFLRYNRLRSPVVLVSSLTGRTSILPTRAGGICEASWMASFRSAASIR